jgi:hypothetical protein
MTSSSMCSGPVRFHTISPAIMPTANPAGNMTLAALLAHRFRCVPLSVVWFSSFDQENIAARVGTSSVMFL